MSGYRTAFCQGKYTLRSKLCQVAICACWVVYGIVTIILWSEGDECSLIFILGWLNVLYDMIVQNIQYE